jgi:hypothetical protein
VDAMFLRVLLPDRPEGIQPNVKGNKLQANPFAFYPFK